MCGVLIATGWSGRTRRSDELLGGMSRWLNAPAICRRPWLCGWEGLSRKTLSASIILHSEHTVRFQPNGAGRRPREPPRRLRPSPRARCPLSQLSDRRVRHQLCGRSPSAVLSYIRDVSDWNTDDHWTAHGKRRSSVVFALKSRLHRFLFVI